MQTLTPELISAAIEGFQAQKARIDSQIAELRAMLPGAAKIMIPGQTAAGTGSPSKRSDEVRQRMAEAQRQRWVKIKGESKPFGVSATPAKKARKKFSAATLKRMREAQQLRWAKNRGESAPPAPTPAESPKPKRKLSATARAKLAANLAKARAAKAAMAKAAAN